MEPNKISDFWIEDPGAGSDCDLRSALESFCAGVRDETSSTSKACREKMRRDRLNDRFLELSSVLDPGRPPKSDKARILSDAVLVLAQLRNEVEQLKEANVKLQDTIKQLKIEKNELREEKLELKLNKEKLEQHLKATTIPPARFMPPPIALHPAGNPAIYAAPGQASTKNAAPLSTFPAMAMWQWLPPAFLDTTQDPKLWPPHA